MRPADRIPAAQAHEQLAQNAPGATPAVCKTPANHVSAVRPAAAEVVAVAFAPVGQRATTGSADITPRTWDFARGSRRDQCRVRHIRLTARNEDSGLDEEIWG